MCVQGKAIAIAEAPSVAWLNVPISAIDPGAGFSGMSISGPFRELHIEPMIELVEDLCADYSSVVVAPACNLWIEKSNEVFLRGRFVATNALGERFAMTLDGVGTRCDERFEAFSPCTIELARPILTDRETQEVEARCFSFLEEGVSKASFLGMQFKADALEPFFREVSTCLDDGFVPVKNHQVVGIPNDLRFPIGHGRRLRGVQADLPRKLGANVRFESMQSAIR